MADVLFIKNDKKNIKLWKLKKLGSIIHFVVSNQPDRVLTNIKGLIFDIGINNHV